MKLRPHLIALVLTLGPLGGCAVDSHISYVPGFLKQTEAQPEIEQPPDVAAFLRGNMSAVFTETSLPSNVRFSFPIPGQYGGWDSCIRGDVKGVTGLRIGNQTYLINIYRGKVGRRERVGDDHWCASETYQAL
ncbi:MULTISPECIES: hypothetical protein [Rhodopseudomonas]|uniref:Lipoprotein n=1 Tax=Rhodopseudomonas palustris TaxID=1076 RepID=A0A0D7EL86_RHOPL|nr:MULTISPECIES: hypothetical protein [Rhodopseudomonas]KIZ40202.1 hypothetical protein OO17_18305 [Rhodopseudomonas palustris]MDF3809978.1 hypothetical protein [Rhodopseudomonas sp. BAL398]WOK20464.1 hypothetical protein RBJ75_13485 [Rhodopseudomonas sp. BAL398]